MMITRLNLSVRSATNTDRHQLATLLQLEPYVHRHLDWRRPLDWLGHQPFLVAERRGSLAAALACPPDPPGVAWIRTFASSVNVSTKRAWDLLWPEIQKPLRAQPGLCVAAIPLYKWFRTLLEHSDFEHTHDVVLLSWSAQDLPPPDLPLEVEIRAMAEEDLPAVAALDHAAFRSIWRNSQETLRLAYQQSVCSTVATAQGEIVGYQISTPSPRGWHLARLAVRPENQRRGIAQGLVRHLQSNLYRRGAYQITVNTQHDNEASLYLYEKAGFVRTGEEYPVYQYLFNGALPTGV